MLERLLRHGGSFRAGGTAFSQQHRRWIDAQRPDDPLAQVAAQEDAA